MRHPPRWQVDINWEALQLPTHDLSELEVPFSEEEIKHAVHQMPSDKASGPDGYTGIFVKSCWDIIKEDVIKATNAFYSLQVGNLDILNSANVVLIPKTEGVESITDFQPISLIHSFTKIIAKLLALRLAPHMSSIISTTQSAFIKKKKHT
jgi:hypothetical protein